MIGMKKIPFKNLNILEKLYIPEIIRGLSITFRYILGKKVTMQYPEDRWELAPLWRGAPVLRWDYENNREKCVACLLCMRSCPPEAIYIEGTEAEKGVGKEKRPQVFEINMGICIFCGYCEEACPEDAIFLSKEYELADYTRHILIRNKETLLELGKEAEETGPKRQCL